MSGCAHRLVRIKTPTFIDLFCGCGGFTLGMQRAGFRCVAAIDSNSEAIKVFRANFPSVPHILEKDLKKFGPAKLATLVGRTPIDVIVGGPPCQGFSTARQVDWANHGSRVKRDKRRYLYREFLEYVRYFKPSVFVIENVLGIQTAAKGVIFTRLQAEARSVGYRVHPQVEEAWKLGVPQKRRRQLIIGVRTDIPGYFPAQLLPAKRAGFGDGRGENVTTLWDAIGDLPPLRVGRGSDDREYDFRRRETFLKKRGWRAAHYQKKVLEIARAKRLTGHRARPHNEQDLRDFARLREGEHSAEAIERGEPMEFTYKREIFKDRFKRQHREELCSTIVAHLSKDGLMFIHPTQNRSLTAREAARIQSFPDWFVFPVTRTHQFRIIGNAVPPLIAEAVAEEVLDFAKAAGKHARRKNSKETVPSSRSEAINRLLPFVATKQHVLRRIPAYEFKLSWHAVAFLHHGLHPAAALDHGKLICCDLPDEVETASGVERRFFAPYFERSGWPVVLAPIVKEAWRRYNAGELNRHEFYAAAAQSAGIIACNGAVHLTRKQAGTAN
jgi:DNA (cytosine-5)-methyltransferase 1